MTTENSTSLYNISITEMHHEHTNAGILVWGAGMHDDGVQRWAAHMEKHTDEIPADLAKAFTECQKNIVAMFHGNPLKTAPMCQEDPPPVNTEASRACRSDRKPNGYSTGRRSQSMIQKKKKRSLKGHARSLPTRTPRLLSKNSVSRKRRSTERHSVFMEIPNHGL